MSKKIKSIICIFILFSASFIVNFYYGSIGVFPIDTFAFFDTAFAVNNGYVPFRDYWTISGPFIDYVQSFIFLILGHNWFAYLFHSSMMNGIFVISTFYFFNHFKLNVYLNYFSCACLIMLAYPSVGVPFPDHHSIFLSIISLYLLIYSLDRNFKFGYFLFPIIFFFAFFSKQTPAAYLIIIAIFILMYETFYKKNYSWVKNTIISIFVVITFLTLFILLNNISFENFLIQYFLFPKTIGAERLKNYNLNFNNLIADFKFIYIFLLPIFYSIGIKFIKNKNLKKDEIFFYNILFVFFIFTIIFHQIITKNQIFIFFIIPIIFSFTFLVLKKNFIKSKYYLITMILLMIFITMKYHHRFNEDRKFMELSKINKVNYVNASEISDNLRGLKLITKKYSLNPHKEAELLRKSISFLEKEKRNLILITEYQFISSNLEKNIFSFNRWYTTDGVSYPLKGNKYRKNYKKFYNKQIIKNNIKLIYTIKPKNIKNIKFIFDKDCIKTNQINQILYEHNLKNCVIN